MEVTALDEPASVGDEWDGSQGLRWYDITYRTSVYSKFAKECKQLASSIADYFKKSLHTEASRMYRNIGVNDIQIINFDWEFCKFTLFTIHTDIHHLILTSFVDTMPSGH